MANSLFDALNKNNQNQKPNNSMNNYVVNLFQFMNQMRGRNSSEVLNELIQKNGITQEQLNQIQERAQQVAPQFNILRKIFGFK